MITAGEEALSSSASREAIGYYREALDLYLKKYGETANPEKLAMLEKNIAIALSNKGEMEEALDYFDRVLSRWGISPPKSKIFILLKFLFDLFIVILNLYFPSRKAKKVPTQKDKEIFYLSHKKDETLVALNPMRQFTEGIGTTKRILMFDFKEIHRWYYTLLSASGAFSYSGLSFGLSNKILEYGKPFIDKNNSRELFSLKVFSIIHNVFSGKWEKIQEYDDSLIEANLRVGEFFNVTMYIFFFTLAKIYQGKLNEVYPLLEKLSEIADDYEFENAKVWQLILELQMFIQYRKLDEVQKSIEKWESLYKMGADVNTIEFLGYKAELPILLKDYNGVEETFRRIKEISKKQVVIPPMAKEPFLWSRFSFDISLLEESILSNKKSNFSKYSKQASKSCKKLLLNSNKFQVRRTGTLNMVVRYYWLISKQNKAVSFWEKAIEEGERLEQRPDLARTYMEIGKRFLEEKSKFKELNGISAKEYLEKARGMFQEMDLQWDLDELDKITAPL